MLSFTAVTDCRFLTPNYLYCHPPPPKKAKFGSCGNCHCINGDKPCPSDPDKIPFTQVSNDWLQQYKNMDAINPILMTCNPYNTTNYLQCTNPPLQESQIELWETAVCGHVYDMTTLDANQCPTQYEMITYNSKEEMEAAGNAIMTHWGAVRSSGCSCVLFLSIDFLCLLALIRYGSLISLFLSFNGFLSAVFLLLLVYQCGACSTSKDLAVYLGKERKIFLFVGQIE